jgi:hypothetical protein
MGRKIYIDEEQTDKVKVIAWRNSHGEEERITLDVDSDCIEIDSEVTSDKYCYQTDDIPHIIKALQLAVKEGWCDNE